VADPDRAFYGPGHIEIARERGAIDTLLVTDALFRAPDVALRRRFVALVDETRENNGKVYILSTQHVSGERASRAARST